MSLHLNAIFSFYLRLILNIHYSLIVFVRAWADKNNIPVSKYILTIGSICIFSMFCRWRILKLLDRRLARLQQRYNLKLKNWIHSYVSTQPTLQTLQALQSSSELLRLSKLMELGAFSQQPYRTACKLLTRSWNYSFTKSTTDKIASQTFDSYYWLRSFQKFDCSSVCASFLPPL